ncbi:MAG: hypothetical protein K9M45_06460 [Kiritimatiellales bacterium]|nr:hypothetical protein [Kiritimatiellales bacterium]
MKLLKKIRKRLIWVVIITLLALSAAFRQADWWMERDTATQLFAEAATIPHRKVGVTALPDSKPCTANSSPALKLYQTSTFSNANRFFWAIRYPSSRKGHRRINLRFASAKSFAKVSHIS